MTDLLLYDYPGSICSQMARLALVEKGLIYTRQTIDIMLTAEQFEPWYIALNPAAVVPTLKDDAGIVTDTIRIVNYVNKFPGPDLTLGDAPAVQDWLRRIMALHYGVLLYSGKLGPDRVSPTMVNRAANLKKMAAERPELAEVLAKRIAGNARMQAILKDADQVAEHFASAQSLVNDMATELDRQEYLCGDNYSLADCFATAALARFKQHGFESWWQNGTNASVARYYGRMKSRPGFADAGVVDQ